MVKWNYEGDLKFLHWQSMEASEPWVAFTPPAKDLQTYQAMLLING